MAIPNPTALNHTCFVTRNLEKTAQRLSDTLRIGPWHIWTIELPDCRVYGRKATLSIRLALATVGGGALELITPHKGHSIYSQHLEEYGDGFHHTCLTYASLEAVREAKAELRRQGREEIQEGSLEDIIEFAYFRFPEIGSFVEVLYLDISKLPPPEAIISPSVVAA